MELRPVLIVEDNANDLLLIKKALKRTNLHNPIEVVRDGESALDYLLGKGEFADRNRYPLPELVLLDLNLPKYSGFEVLEKLGSQPDLSRLPVVVLTSSARPADINRAYDLGANSYLVKPDRFEDLVKLVDGINLYWMLFNHSPPGL